MYWPLVLNVKKIIFILVELFLKRIYNEKDKKNKELKTNSKSADIYRMHEEDLLLLEISKYFLEKRTLYESVELDKIMHTSLYGFLLLTSLKL